MESNPTNELDRFPPFAYLYYVFEEVWHATYISEELLLWQDARREMRETL